MNLKSITTLLLFTSFVLFAERGDASWYGKKYQGKPTASGESFDMYAYTGAHRTLPFGTIVNVTNLKNNKSVKVRINDRGPTKKSRIVDLSYQSAKDIGLVTDGIVPVTVEVLSASTKIKTSKKSLNPYVVDKKADQESMKAYASKMPKTEKSLDYKEYLSSKVSTKKKNKIKVQIASFRSRVNAENFIKKQKESAYTMKVIEVENASIKLYKVIVVCDSSAMVRRLLESKRYRGAYIFKK